MNGKFALLMLAIIPLHCAFTSKCKNTWQVWATHVGFPDTSFGDKWKNVFPPWWNLSLGVWKTSETNTKSQYRLCNCLCSLLFCLFLGLRLLKNKCPLSSIPPPHPTKAPHHLYTWCFFSVVSRTSLHDYSAVWLHFSATKKAEGCFKKD